MDGLLILTLGTHAPEGYTYIVVIMSVDLSILGPSNHLVVNPFNADLKQKT